MRLLVPVVPWLSVGWACLEHAPRDLKMMARNTCKSSTHRGVRRMGGKNRDLQGFAEVPTSRNLKSNVKCKRQPTPERDNDFMTQHSKGSTRADTPSETPIHTDTGKPVNGGIFSVLTNGHTYRDRHTRTCTLHEHTLMRAPPVETRQGSTRPVRALLVKTGLQRPRSTTCQPPSRLCGAISPSPHQSCIGMLM